MSVAEPLVLTPPPRPTLGDRLPVPARETDGTAELADGHFELVNGVRVEKTMSAFEQVVAGLIHEHLAPFCTQAGIGRAVIETKFAIPGNGNERQPDAGFVSFDRWPRDRGIPRRRAWPVAPDLVIEVVSPTDEGFEVVAKIHEYFAGGVRSVWLVWSNVEQVYCYSSPNSVRILSRGDELAGDPVVPGFRMPLADLFPPAEAEPVA